MTVGTQNIVVELAGGLGNQLFQYAYAQALFAELSAHADASRAPYKLWLDGTSVQRDVQRSFLLYSMLKTNGSIAQDSVVGSRKKLFSLLGERIHTTLNFREKLLHRLRPYTAPSKAQRYLFFSEDALLSENNGECAAMVPVIAERLLKNTQPVFIQGFWQYGAMVEKLLNNSERDFLCMPKTTPPFTRAHEYVQACSASVSLHVRRTDYLNAEEEYPPCSVDYYACAVAHLKKQLMLKQGAMSVLVFSDDTKWCEDVLIPALKQNDASISYKLVSHVSDGSLSDIEELILMSACSHHVLANSSFSWWGSGMLHKVFLPHQKKDQKGMVIAPKHWTTDVQRTTRIHMKDWVLF